MAEYLFLIRGGEEGMAKMTDDEKKVHMGEWGMYLLNLQTSGSFVGGSPLENDGVVISGQSKTESNGKYTAGEPVGGYFIVKTDTIGQAKDISLTCPIFSVDGSVEIRPLQSMGM